MDQDGKKELFCSFMPEHGLPEGAVFREHEDGRVFVYRHPSLRIHIGENGDIYGSSGAETGALYRIEFGGERLFDHLSTDVKNWLTSVFLCIILVKERRGVRLSHTKIGLTGVGTMNQDKRKRTAGNGANILSMTLMALMTALICVLSPLSIQLPGQVPISPAFAVIYLAVYLLGGVKGTICCALYLLIGLIGIPVFSGFGSGIGKLAGPTGGYLVGYIFLAAVCGAALYIGRGRIWVYIIGMALGGLAAYLFGSLWFMYSMQTSLKYTLSVCVYPFIPFDLAKIAAVAVLGPILKKQLRRIDGIERAIAY